MASLDGHWLWKTTSAGKGSAEAMAQPPRSEGACTRLATIGRVLPRDFRSQKKFALGPRREKILIL